LTFFNDPLKANNKEKSAVGDKAFHTFASLPVKKLWRTVFVHLGLYNLYRCPLFLGYRTKYEKNRQNWHRL